MENGQIAYRNLEDELLAIVLGLKGVQNGRELLSLELDVDDGTDDLMNATITRGNLLAGIANEGRVTEV